MTPVCVMKHIKDPDRPRPARHGLLCVGHHHSLERHLSEMPALASEVEPGIIQTSMGGGPKVGGTRSQPLPYVDTVSDALRHVRDTLASWTAQIVEQHPDQLHPPRFGTYPTSVFLLRHLDWISGQDWISDFHGEVSAARRELLHALDTSRTKKVPLGPCDERTTCDLITHEEVTCTGIMRAVVRTSDDELPAEISCTVCGTTKQPSEWRALSRRLRGGLDPMLTASQLSQLFRVPVGTVHYWAHEDTWRRDGEKPRRYHSEDAQASFDRRRQTREAS